MVGSLSQPVELIRVQRSGGPQFRCAVAEMQGWRASHEDAHAVRCDGQLADFWVLDGHRGDESARFGAATLPDEVHQAMLGGKGGLPADRKLQKIFQTVDARLRGHLERCPAGGRRSGSTAVGALVARQADGSYSAKLVNCGDSRGVVVLGPSEEKAVAATVSIRLPQQLEMFGQSASWAAGASWLPPWPAIVETIDHKPGSLTERARIEAAGGTVCGGKRARLDGCLAVSRGLGDFEFKVDRGRQPCEQRVSCIPDVYELSGLQPGTLIILACDGLWDVMSSKGAALFVRSQLQRDPKADLGDIAAALIRTCLQKKSGDNVTVMLVHFVEGSVWADAEDEMVGCEKLRQHDDMDEDIWKQYQRFLRRSSFALELCTAA